jgi:hypothetical protein
MYVQVLLLNGLHYLFEYFWANTFICLFSTHKELLCFRKNPIPGRDSNPGLYEADELSSAPRRQGLVCIICNVIVLIERK